MQILEHNLGTDAESVRVSFLSDAHIGDACCTSRGFRNYIDEILDDPYCYVVLNGDLMNNALSSSVSDSYSESIDPQAQLDHLYNILEPLKERILVITEGNHELRTYKQAGIKPMQQLAYMLFGKNESAKVYSPGAWLMYLSFGANRGRECRQTVYAVYGKHGSGGGKRVGSKMNRLEDMGAVVDADIFIHSHTHVPAAFRTSRYRVDYRNRKVTEHEQLFVNTNAWLNFGGYGEDCGFSPTSQKPPLLFLEGNKRYASVLI